MPGADKAGSPFKRFAALARKLAAVPKTEIKEQKALGEKAKPPTPKVS